MNARVLALCAVFGSSLGPALAGPEPSSLGQALEVIWRVGGEDTLDFYGIRAISFDASNNLYVLDSSAHRVRSFSPEGTPIATFGREGQGPGELDTPRDILWSRGQILVADRGNGRIEFFTTSGEYIRSQRLPACTPPEYLETDGDRYYVSTRGDMNSMACSFSSSWDLLERFSGETKVTRFFGRYGAVAARGFLLVLDSRLWYVYQQSRHILEFRTNGEVVAEYDAPQPITLLTDGRGDPIPEVPLQRAAAVDPGGKVYVVYTNPEEFASANELHQFNAPIHTPRPPTTAEREYADLLGPDGCRAEFLRATWLANKDWFELDAVAALSVWYGRNVETLELVEWIVGAAHADDVLRYRPGGDAP